MSSSECLPQARPGRPVVLVTGAARRLGRAIALHLGRCGWDVAVHYRGSAVEAAQVCAELDAAGARAGGFAADLGDAAQVRQLPQRVVQQFGRLDAVVNNASVFEYDSAQTFGAAAAEHHYRINAIAPVLLAQGLHAHLIALGARGCVVNLLDQKLWNPNPDHFAYTLSKAALHEATTMLAQALAPHVRVLGVAPGMTLGSALIDDTRLAQLQRQGPLGEGPSADDVAGAVEFCLRSPALTGSTILVDAGQHLQRRARDFAFPGPSCA